LLIGIGSKLPLGLPGGCPADLRPVVGSWPKHYRTAPEAFPNHSRTIVEALSKATRTTVEETAAIGTDLCQSLPITAKSLSGRPLRLRLYPESGNTGMTVLSEY